MPLRQWNRSPTVGYWSNPNSKAAARCKSLLKIPAAASTRKLSTESSTHSSQPRPMAWEWAYRFAGRSSNRMVGACGLLRAPPVERSSGSLCRLAALCIGSYLVRCYRANLLDSICDRERWVVAEAMVRRKNALGCGLHNQGQEDRRRGARVSRRPIEPWFQDGDVTPSSGGKFDRSHGRRSMVSATWFHILRPS